MKTGFVIVILLLNIVHHALAQTTPTCLDTTQTKLQFPGGRDEAMDHFVAKLDTVLIREKSRVNIMHIGGSHIQADIYSDVVRHALDSINNPLTPPRGFLFPFKVAGTNNPTNYRTRGSATWTTARNAINQFEPEQGLSGILIYTSDTASWFSVEMNTDSLSRWQSDEIVLLAEAKKGQIEPLLFVDDTLKYVGAKEKNGYRFTLPRPVDHFAIRLRSEVCAVADTFIVRGLIAESNEPGIVYHSIGVNGASVPSYLGCQRFEDELREISPDLVIFSLGINDATHPNFTDSVFVANYNQLIERIRRVVPRSAMIFISNNDSFFGKKLNPNGLVAQEAFRRLAAQWHAGFWDLFGLMGGLNSIVQWEAAGLARRDKVHFTPEGYRLVGQMFSEALLDFYLNYDSDL